MASLSLPDLTDRCLASEWMDDFSVDEHHLRGALRDLRLINRLLGGYRATNTMLDPLLSERSSLRLLDVGTGSGDYLVHLVQRGATFGCRVDATGIDLNPMTVGLGRAHLDACLSSTLRSQVRIDIENALRLPYPDNAFDVAHAALFLHHFDSANAVQLLSEMARVSRMGLVVNDLHRHRLAYLGIWGLSRALGLAPMVQHDGPMSVRRGFRRPELATLAHQSGVGAPHIRWHWAFRWTLSTVPTEA